MDQAVVAIGNLHRLGLNLIDRISVCLKVAKRYDPANVNVQDAAEELIRTVRTIHRTGGGATLQVMPGFVALNGIRIRAPIQKNRRTRTLVHGLRSRGIGALNFHHRLIKEDVTGFSRLFHSTAPKDEDPYRALKDAMSGCGISTIEIVPTRRVCRDVADTDAQRCLKEQSIRQFFQTIRVSRAIIKTDSSRQKELRRARRVVQSLVDTVAEDEVYLLALTAIKNYDDYTENHSANVAIYSIALGQRLGLCRQDLADLGMAGLVHDIGNTLVPQEILDKPGRLDPCEWTQLKNHSVYGAELLLRGSKITESVIRYVFVAFEHHLTLDFEGDPARTDRRDLSLFSKIVAIADCFDALTTPRPYRGSRYRPHAALSIMLDGRGTLFDPVLLKVFVNAIGVHPIGTVVELETGELGVVLRTKTAYREIDKPLIRVFRDADGNAVTLQEKDLAKRDANGRLLHRIVSSGTAGEHFGCIGDFVDVL